MNGWEAFGRFAAWFISLLIVCAIAVVVGPAWLEPWADKAFNFCNGILFARRHRSGLMSNDSPSPEAVLAMLQPGEAIGTDALQTIEFGGRTWFVHNFAGNQTKAALLLKTEPSHPDQPGERLGEIIATYVTAAVNVAILSADWSKVQPEPMLAHMAQMLGEIFEETHAYHMRMLAARKPS